MLPGLLDESGWKDGRTGGGKEEGGVWKGAATGRKVETGERDM